MKEGDAKFVGSIPDVYDECLGPVIFAPHARELASRITRAMARSAADAGGSLRLLETACGTGILTRALLSALPTTTEITATDLNGAMVERAQRVVAPTPRITWRVADAMELPFPTAAFDAVACQFGLMFVPDKGRALKEAARVLKPGGTLHFSVWCGLEDNAYGRIARDVTARFFATNPPTFYEVPFGFHDHALIERLLNASGFTRIAIEKATLEATAASARHFARGLVEGNPIATSIREAGLDSAPIIEAVARELIVAGGDAPFRMKTRALVCEATRA